MHYYFYLHFTIIIHDHTDLCTVTRYATVNLYLKKINPLHAEKTSKNFPGFSRIICSLLGTHKAIISTITHLVIL